MQKGKLLILVVSVLSALLISGSLVGCGSSSVENNKKIAQAEVMALGPDKLAERLTYFATDAVVWDSVIKVMGYADTNTMTGQEQVKGFLTWLTTMPPVQARILSVFGEGENVAVDWVLFGGEGATAFEIPCANLYEFKDGKIKSVKMQFDSYFFAKLVGK